MKTYAIIVSAVAVLMIFLAGYFFWQGGEVRHRLSACKNESQDLSETNANFKNQLAEAKQIVAVLKPAADAFIFPGDYRAQAIGSREATEVENLINALNDKTNRISAEQNWNEFMRTREFNPFFGMLRSLLGSLDFTLNRVPGSNPPLQ